jgi:hypothetical protein
VEDAVNLGWKVAAVLNGWGGHGLLASYETERQAIAQRNTAYARGFADSVGLFVPPPELEEDSPAGEAARKRTGDHFNYHARFEFNIPGITFGGRYDGSPIIIGDHTLPPPDRPSPGGRRPICGSQTGARFTIRSASNSPCCNLAENMTPRRSRPRRSAGASADGGFRGWR